MLTHYRPHNLFRENITSFHTADPHLSALASLRYQYDYRWWYSLSFSTHGIYILTGGRQIGKSTSCKLLIKECLANKQFSSKSMFYLPCDEIYDAKTLATTIRSILDDMIGRAFLLIIDEITYVKNWDRVIKALADEGRFKEGICLLTGSDTLILKEAAMRFPGRRGAADITDFHLYPLSFADYTSLITNNKPCNNNELSMLFNNYLKCGGYLRAINDLAEYQKVTQASYTTYEQWIRSDFLQRGKNEDTLLSLLQTLLQTGVSQISYSTLNQNMGLTSKDTCIDYCRLLERIGVLFNLKAYDQNKKQGFPRKDRKFHLLDPFMYHTIANWISREKGASVSPHDSTLVEATVASHCRRLAPSYYFKGQGEIDVICLKNGKPLAIEIKWSRSLKPSDIKMLKNFKENSIILTKHQHEGKIEGIVSMPVYEFLNNEQFKLPTL